MKSYILGFFICFFNFTSACFSQTTVGMPVQFIQFFKTYSLVNPASIGSDSAIDLSVGNKSLLGAFNGVRTFYVSGNIPLRPFDLQKSNHMLGFNFINDKEGSYINRNRASILYAIRIPLNYKVSFNAGVSGGFINYSFEATNILAGGSVFAPNADLGLWLHSPTLNIGVSGNQIIPTKFRPIDQSYTITRHYNIIGEKAFLISPYFMLKPAFIFRWQDKNNYNADAALIALIQRTVSIVASYKYTKGVALSGGLENIRIGDNIMRMMFSYYTPLSGNAYYNPQSYELSVNFLSSRGR